MNKITEKDPQITKGKLTVIVMTSYKLENAEDTTVFIHEILFQHGKDCLLHTFGIRCENSGHKLDDILAEESVYIVLNVIKEEVQNYSYNGDLGELVRRVDAHFYADEFGCYYAQKCKK